MHAFDACRVGRYPTPSSPGKLAAYQHSLRMFRKAAKHFDPPLEIIELPFEGKTLIGYLQTPPGVAKPPVVCIGAASTAGRKDRLRIAKAVMDAGLASLTIDMPGTGENPVLYGDPAAERTYFTWMDHLAQRHDLDGRRVAVWGGSFGAYWAARLAFVAADRIKGAVFHGGNVHYGFQREWLVPAFTTGGATYLFGAASLLEARGRAMGTKTAGRISWRPRPDSRSRPWACSTSRRRRSSASTASSTTRRRSRTSISADGARQPEVGAHLSRRPPHGPHARPAADHITAMIVDWLKEQLTR